MDESFESRPVSFHGKGGTLFGIHITVIFLTLVTLGIYSFWGRVKIRKYLWGQMEFDGDRLSYHGTGWETLRGWIKAFLVFVIPYILVSHGPLWMGAGPWVIGIGVLLSVLLIAVFIPMAVVGSHRYRLSRTAWRGIRFSFRETWQHYLTLFWGGNLLTLLTLGIYSPFFRVSVDRFLITNSYVGNRHFGYDGEGTDLVWKYLLAVVLAVPTLGFSLYWYSVYMLRYRWDHTTLGDARFESTITAGDMLGVVLVNLLLVVFTVGFAYPWAQVRYIDYLTRNLSLKGPADLGSIEQDAQGSNATGEELASFLSLDFDLG